MKRFIALLILVFLLANNKSVAQKIKIKNYSFGYNIYEINGVGNNPQTLAPLLKDPFTYLRNINNTQYNGSYSNSGVNTLHDYYLNVKLYKTSSARFWKRHTIQAGLLISNKLTKTRFGLENRQYSSGDTLVYLKQYSLSQKLQFIGGNIGANRRFNIFRKLQFFTGFHFQGSFAFIHRYQQQFDSSIFSQPGGWQQIKSFRLPDLKGKFFLEWQAMIPVGLEIDVYKKEIFLRLEADAGIIGSPYRSKNIFDNEAHGIGLWLIYRPK